MVFDASSSVLWIMMTLTLPNCFPALRCYHGHKFSRRIKTNAKLCAYYHTYNNLECNNQYMGTVGFDTAAEAEQYNMKCGVFLDTAKFRVVACFCDKDLCNKPSDLKRNFDITTINAEPLNDIGSWTGVDLSENSIKLMECFRWDILLNSPAKLQTPEEQPISEGTEEEEEEGSILPTLAVIAAVIIFFCCVLPLLYYLREERRKRVLAETWETRVKKAGEELSSSESGLSVTSEKAEKGGDKKKKGGGKKK